MSSAPSSSSFNTPLDRATVEQVNRLLAQTGERARLKDILRSKLIECGWSDRVQAECYSKCRPYWCFNAHPFINQSINQPLTHLLDEIKSRGVDKISPQDLFESMSNKAKSKQA